MPRAQPLLVVVIIVVGWGWASLTARQNADVQAESVVQVDAFVFDDAALDDLVEAGAVSRAVCRDCGSRRVRELPVISHSLSIPQLRYIFEALLGPARVNGKIVLDVGSRLGAALFGGYFFSKASKLVGVELQTHYCRLTQEMARRFSLGERITIVEGDIRLHASQFAGAGVVIFNNVFEFFADRPLQRELWCFVLGQCRKNPGLFIVSNPSLQDALRTAEVREMDTGATVTLFSF